jgi:transcriptional regulator with XRE-family HTH domain
MRHGKEMGRLIRQMRESVGMTVQQLADLLEIEKGTLSKKETAHSAFTDAELDRLAHVFRTERWRLYAIAAGVPVEKLDWMDAYDSVSDGFRDDVLRLVRTKRVEAGK